MSSEPKKGEIVPFGKYKGQPIEAMAEDKKYADWLAQQPWFREKHGNLYAIVINNFCEPSETPEHNALQARFLDDDFRLQFASVAIPRLWWYGQASGEMVESMASTMAKELLTALLPIQEENEKKRREYEASKADFQQRKVTNPALAYEPVEPTYGAASMNCHLTLSAITRDRPVGDDLVRIGSPIFEANGVDCVFWVVAGFWCWIETHRGVFNQKKVWRGSKAIDESLRIEIKPEVGDDYPAILRQMRRNGSTILFTRAYIGQGVDEATFIRFMESQKIRVIFESDVDNSEKISVDTFSKNEFLKLVHEKFATMP